MNGAADDKKYNEPPEAGLGAVYSLSVPAVPPDVFSESFGRTDTSRGYRYNLIPFNEITRYFRHSDVVGPLLFLINIVGNVVAFVPFGFFLPIISRRSKKWYNTVMLGFGFSLTLETLQLIFMVGSFDVDDMILNTLGAAWVCDLPGGPVGKGDIETEEAGQVKQIGNKYPM